jgi:hypothetical protein
MKQLLLVSMLVAMSATAAAQQPAPAPAPERAPAQAAPPQQEVPNLRFDIAIADEGGGAPPTRKNVSVLARANNQTASVRSLGQLNAGHPLAVAAKSSGIGVGLSVDVRGLFFAETGKIGARVTVDYQPYWPDAKSLPSSVRAQVDAVFDQGKPTLISQAADPLSDRRTTIEVTVTVLK